MSIDSPRQSPRLALHGGEPTLPGPPPTWPCADEEVREALAAAYADGSWGRYHGPHCRRLAERLCEMQQVEFATLTCSGTFAVELALRALKIGPGDEVILAGYDFPGNFRSIEATGARPVLVDIDPRTWGLDVSQLDAALGPVTRAILVSHLHGGLIDMRAVTEFAAAHSLSVVEDACQAPGAQLDGRVAGSWGDVGVLSFGGSKLLTAGRGGAIITRHAEVHQRAKVFSDRGNQAFPLSELQAAVLVPQLEKLAERNRRRGASVGRLLARTAQLPGLQPLANQVAGAVPSFYKLAWLYDAKALGNSPVELLVAAAQAEGVPLDTGFRGFTRRTDRRCRKVGELRHSLKAAETTILLHHPILLESDKTVDLVASALEKIVRALSEQGASGP